MTHSAVDGLLNLNKPPGITSARALYRVRKLTGVRRSGHAGTLDPTAEGVLLICMGKATKRVEQLMALPKTYRSVARLDVTSRSYDSEARLEPVAVGEVPDRLQVEQAARQFVGEIMQVPPAVSALKIKGQPAYRRARRGEKLDLPPRPVVVHEMKILAYTWPTVELEVVCGRGTYIRAIARDLGQALGCGGCLTSLKRLSVGPFHVQDAACFQDLEQGRFEEKRISLAQLDGLLAEENQHS